MATAYQTIESFLLSDVHRPLLGLVYGRRRIGKSTMLVELARTHHGFYFEAARVATPVQLDRLGRAIGDHLGVGRLALGSWEEAIDALIGLGSDHRLPVVLDEFGYVLEADPSVPSLIAAALGPGGNHRESSSARLILCGSAITVMRSLTAGQAPLRGRAGLEYVMLPDDFRAAAERLPSTIDRFTASQVFAVIGGVVGYATDMVNFDLPSTADDFDRWVVDRLLAPGATLHQEATTLLAEDPVVQGPGALLHHSLLSAIANGSITPAAMSRRIGRPISNLAPALHRLIEAGFVVRHDDPIRDRRPLYALGDPFLQFHFAVMEPHRSVLRDREIAGVWSGRLRPVFDSQVRGPVAEEMARSWVRKFASETTVPSGLIGPSRVNIEGVAHELDLVVAAPGDDASDRQVVAIGEAKAGESLGLRHLERLERARVALGPRASGAKLLLFGVAASSELTELAERRPDIEVVDLERLYEGS